jgi:REP element-mobilizing transposase RayT
MVWICWVNYSLSSVMNPSWSEEKPQQGSRWLQKRVHSGEPDVGIQRGRGRPAPQQRSEHHCVLNEILDACCLLPLPGSLPNAVGLGPLTRAGRPRPALQTKLRQQRESSPTMDEILGASCLLAVRGSLPAALPHIYGTENPVFLTWRLYGSRPANRRFPRGTLTAGQQFAVMDRLLEDARAGPFFLRQAVLAQLVVEAIHYNARALGQYVLHAFVVMPNHVHLLVTARVPIPELTKSLKGITARRANQTLGQTGSPFWQEETYDHEVRQEGELERIRAYIESDPVRSGLVTEASQYRWSSAGWALTQ